MAKPPSLAEELFRKIESQPDPSAFLEAMANPSNPPTFESDYLDFKAKPDNDPKNSKLKEMWFEALSGFGNSGGGVLLWGIDARKDPTTGIDAACGICPIQNPNAFKSLLVELQRGATDPPLGNVRIEAWESKPGEGFVACLIPSGPFKPYRAEVSGKKQFWLRSADSFYVPSVAIVRALLNPQPIAIFKAYADLEAIPDPDFVKAYDQHKILTTCHVAIENTGFGTAQLPHVVIEVGADLLSARTRAGSHWYFNDNGDTNLTFERELPIHPGAKVPLVTLFWQTPAGSLSSPAIRLTFRFFAGNQPQQSGEIIFPACPWVETTSFRLSESFTASE
jgi:hypothetical protein